MDWQKFKKLNYLSSTQDNSDTCVILFHGYGADASDLASLGRVYKLSENTDWYFPQGPLQVPIGPMMSGRAWFNLRTSDFEKAADGTIKESKIYPEDEKLLNEVVEWLNHLGKLYKRVFIGGFSQGAILTSHSFYRLNFAPAGLVLLSGFMVAPSSFPIIPDELKIPFFQSHGQRDEVLSIAGAKKLYDSLNKMGLKGRWMEFSGAHEIPMDVIAESQIFLNSVLSSQG